AFIADRRIVLATGHSSLPCLAEGISGRALVGSWMAGREVYRIYAILKAVLKVPSVVAVPLILGKETLIDQSLAPAIARVAADPARRLSAIAQLPPLARQLLAQVEAEREIRMDRLSVPTTQSRRARGLLERELLVVSRDLHTERGYHTSVVMAWGESSIARRFMRRARRLEYEEAQDLLVRAAMQSAVCVPEREARRWFVFGPTRFDALVKGKQLHRFTSGRTIWFATV
ncbi:MAG TPA: hypothetical protein VNA31_06920, partial [bacterium]|nr:hypothetical protein [bacterium]